MKVALDPNRMRVQKVFGLIVAFIGDAGVDVNSECWEDVESKGKWVATEGWIRGSILEQS